MKKYLVLCLLAFFGITGLSAQVTNITPQADLTPVKSFDLRQLSNHLTLSYDQVVVLKTYYADTFNEMFDDLQPVPADDLEQREAIEYGYVVLRDVKIREVLTDEQMPLYEQMQDATIIDPDIDPLPGGGGGN